MVTLEQGEQPLLHLQRSAHVVGDGAGEGVEFRLEQITLALDKSQALSKLELAVAYLLDHLALVARTSPDQHTLKYGRDATT